MRTGFQPGRYARRVGGGVVWVLSQVRLYGRDPPAITGLASLTTAPEGAHSPSHSTHVAESVSPGASGFR
jgi:hypothetical protein